jgi:hypothetical protein
MGQEEMGSIRGPAILIVNWDEGPAYVNTFRCTGECDLAAAVVLAYHDVEAYLLEQEPDEDFRLGFVLANEHDRFVAALATYGAVEVEGGLDVAESEADEVPQLIEPNIFMISRKQDSCDSQP